MTSRCVGLLYTHSNKMGYGRMGTQIAAALQRRGIEVFDWVKGWPLEPVDQIINVGTPQTVIWASTPAQIEGWLEGQHTVLASMWEATVLPETFRENLHCFDQIIVPSFQNQELFGRYHPNVKFVPLGIDPEAWGYRPRKQDGIFFNVLTAGSGERKGIDLAAEAFRKAFPDPDSMDPMPRLIHKSPRGDEGLGLETISGRLSDEEELALYGEAHVYISLARGEGFGLQPLQAIAQGIPTVLSDAHGHASFSHLGWPIRCDLERVEQGNKPEEKFVYGDAGEWWIARVDEAADALREIYFGYDAALQRAANTSYLARKRFSWDEVTGLLLDAVEGPLTPYNGTGAWQPTERKLFHVRVVRPAAYEVGGVSYKFVPGVDYYESADLKRQLWVAQDLEMSCMGDDGVTPATDHLSASDAFCHACNQQLNTGISKAEFMFLQGEVEHWKREAHQWREKAEG